MSRMRDARHSDCIRLARPAQLNRTACSACGFEKNTLSAASQKRIRNPACKRRAGNADIGSPKNGERMLDSNLIPARRQIVNEECPIRPGLRAFPASVRSFQFDLVPRARLPRWHRRLPQRSRFWRSPDRGRALERAPKRLARPRIDRSSTPA